MENVPARRVGDGASQTRTGDLLGATEEVHLELGDDLAVAALQIQRGDLALDRGELSKAVELYSQFLEALDRLGGGPHGDRDVAYGLAGLASVLAERGRDEDAARIWERSRRRKRLVFA
jgi:tetratricopeptide (TPR) repeat protein